LLHRKEETSSNFHKREEEARVHKLASYNCTLGTTYNTTVQLWDQIINSTLQSALVHATAYTIEHGFADLHPTRRI